MLEKIRIVLVETTHPGNIGGAARAMKNMGLSQLALVRPARFPDADATARASGADDLLARARLCATLEEALAGCSLVFGTSARLRALPWPLLDPREAAAAALQAAAGGEVAVVFGREHSGLTNAELGHCNYLLHIPTEDGFSSLNLAAAVQVVSYELRMAVFGGGEEAGAAAEAAEPPATADELEGLYGHLERAMVEIGFLDPENPRQVMHRLRRLFNRARLERTELNILRGILTAAENRRRR